MGAALLALVLSGVDVLIVAALLLGAWLLQGLQGTPTGAAPAEFALGGLVQAAPGAAQVRVELPLAALARMHTADARDVRVRNAQGQEVPAALLRPTPGAPAQWLALAGAQPEGAFGAVWALPSAVPLRAVEVQVLGRAVAADTARPAASAQPLASVPLRLAGRAAAGQPWQLLGAATSQPAEAAGSQDAPQAQVLAVELALPARSWHALRVETANGIPLAQYRLRVRVGLEPLQLVFAPEGAGPFTVWAGRAFTATPPPPLRAAPSAASSPLVSAPPSAPLSAAYTLPATPVHTLWELPAQAMPDWVAQAWVSWLPDALWPQFARLCAAGVWPCRSAALEDGAAPGL